MEKDMININIDRELAIDPFFMKSKTGSYLM